MLKILVLALAFFGFAIIPSVVTEPETPQAMAFHAARDHMLKLLRDNQARADAKAAEDAELARKKKAVDNLTTYLERKWKRPRTELSQIVAICFSQSQQAWPKPLDVLAVIQVESGFNPKARDSTSGSTGLMQINADSHNVTQIELEQPAKNLSWGIRLLRRYRKEMQSDSAALAAYNMGPAIAHVACSADHSCETSYTVKVALAKQELTRHFH